MVCGQKEGWATLHLINNHSLWSVARRTMGYDCLLKLESAVFTVMLSSLFLSVYRRWILLKRVCALESSHASCAFCTVATSSSTWTPRCLCSSWLTSITWQTSVASASTSPDRSSSLSCSWRMCSMSGSSMPPSASMMDLCCPACLPWLHRWMNWWVQWSGMMSGSTWTVISWWNSLGHLVYGWRMSMNCGWLWHAGSSLQLTQSDRRT